MRVGLAMSKLLDPTAPGLFCDEDVSLTGEEVWDEQQKSDNPSTTSSANGTRAKKSVKRSKPKRPARHGGSTGSAGRQQRGGTTEAVGEGPLTETDSDDEVPGSSVSGSSGDSEFETYDLEESDEDGAFRE
jgi:hypothetical protein